MNNDRFNEMMKVILLNECGSGNGYVNDPDDAGGITIYGITRKNHTNLSIWNSILKLPENKRKAYKPTKAQMDEIYNVYKTSYYDKVCGDKISSKCLAMQLFDFAVNAGVSKSVKGLQLVSDVKQDGIMGPITLNAANKGGMDVVDYFIVYRREYYKSLSEKGNNKKFLKGWLNRISNCLNAFPD